MDIWTIAILGGIAFLVLSYLAPKIPNFEMPNIPIINPSPSNETEETVPSTPLPEPIQKGVDELEKSYTLPLWMLVIIFIIVIWIAKR